MKKNSQEQNDRLTDTQDLRNIEEDYFDDEPADDRIYDDADEDYDEPGRKKHGFRPNMHIVLLILIIAVAATAVVRLMIWNMGTKSTYDPSASSSAYDVEVQDNVVSLDPKVLAGRTDDGVNTILFLGNAPISDDTSDTGIAGQVKALGGSDSIDVYSAAFSGSQVACKNARYDTSYVDDAFNFFYVCSSISLGDYTAMENAAALKTDDPSYAQAVQTLKGIDFNKVDTIAVMYDATDYLNDAPVMNANDDEDIQTYAGSLKHGFGLIRDKYPWIRLVFLSPTFAEHDDGNGNLESGDTYDAGNGTLPTYWTKAIDACTSCETVSFIDNYYGSVNSDNCKQYLTDNIHLNAAGRKQVARHFTDKIIKNDYSEFNVNG
jgi:hypothetical protein